MGQKVDKEVLDGLEELLMSSSLDDLNLAEGIINNYITDGTQLDEIYVLLNDVAARQGDKYSQLNDKNPNYQELRSAQYDVLNKVSLMLTNVGIERSYDVIGHIVNSNGVYSITKKSGPDINEISDETINEAL